MSRETENALLLLVGLSIGVVTATGAYTKYVRPTLLPWLTASAVLLVALAFIAIARDIRQGSAYHADGHGHRSALVWLLLVPVALLAFVVPPAIAPSAARTSIVNVSTDVLRRPFPPLPQERAPTISLPELLMRVAQDSASTLDGRLVTVTGFTLKEDGRTDLGRVVIVCCAADAQLARIRLGGPAAAEAARYPENTWLSLEGKVPSGQSDSSGRAIPLVEVFGVSRTDPPANPYAY
jgi:uncharacterized repeat protein (TIGR03943 family)